MKLDILVAARWRLFFGCAITFLAVAVAVAYVATKYQWAHAALSQTEPRYARVAGLEMSAVELERALQDSRATLARQTYSSAQEVSVAGSDAQQRARELFTKAGLQVSSTQILAAKTVDGFDRVPIVLRLEGDVPSLQAALAALPGQAPSLFLEGFNVQTIGMPRPEVLSRLNIQVNLFVLRVRT